MPALAYSVSLKSIEAIFGARGFTPGALFSSGEQGAWYDPSDFSTMFQDAAGTTPVTAVEQPVGLVLDKSKGLVLGSELVDTANSSSAWVAYGTNTVGQDGGAVKVTFVDNANGAYLEMRALGGLSTDLTVGKVYRISFSVRVNTGSVDVQSTLTGSLTTIGTASSTSDTTVTISTLVSATANNCFLRFAGMGTGEIVWISNISVRELPGNHLSQSTSTARPVLSARVNLLTYTEQFDNAAWVKPVGTTTINPNQTTAPDGTNTADLMTASSGSACHYAYQVNSATGAITATVYARAGTASWLGLGSGYTNGNETAWFDLSNGVCGSVASGGTSTMVDAGNGWWRCSHTRSSWTGGGFLTFITNTNNVASFNAIGTESIYIWGADLRPANAGVGLPAYQRVAAATDYDTSGFPLYLKFDGVDDSLATGTINPGAVDKAQVFAGVRKLSDAALGVIAEFSADVSTNNGTFRALAPNAGGTPGYQWLSRGSTLSIAEKSTGYAAPVTNIYAGIGDISGDVSSLRLNGAQVDANVSDQGSGNYGSYPLYVGSRAGSSFRFSGHLYGLIARFSATNLSDATIASTETWVNGKTGAY